MWLTGRLAPDFKTIADFRKDNGPAIRATCRRFVALCRELDLFTHAGGGDRRQQVQGGERPRQELHPAKLKKRMEQVEASIERYMAALETADRQEGELAQAKSVRLKDKIAAAARADAASKALEPVVRRAGPAAVADRPGRPVDGHERRGSGVVGYNVQAAVDAKHHLIVAHEVTNVGHDRGQLATWPARPRPRWGSRRSRCWPTAATSAARRCWPASPWRHALCAQAADLRRQGQGTLRQAGLRLLPDDDVYRCPAGETLTWRFTSVENGMRLHAYWTTNAPNAR
jgi:hypothetical protein